MSNMRKPEMDVIRFKEEDIVAASNEGFQMTIREFANHNAKDGTVTFNNQTYTIDSQASIDSVFAALPSGITSDTQIYITPTVSTSLGNGFQAEANLDGKHAGGATATEWNNTFVYDGSIFKIKQ